MFTKKKTKPKQTDKQTINLLLLCIFFPLDDLEGKLEQ